MVDVHKRHGNYNGDPKQFYSGLEAQLQVLGSVVDGLDRLTNTTAIIEDESALIRRVKDFGRNRNSDFIVYYLLKRFVIDEETRRDGSLRPELHRQLVLTIALRYLKILHHQTRFRGTELKPQFDILAALKASSGASAHLRSGRLDEDLMLYTCIADSCEQPPRLFANVSEWESHMRQRHGNGWMRSITPPLSLFCAKNHHPMWFDGKEDLAYHVHEYHPDIVDNYAFDLFKQSRCQKREVYELRQTAIWISSRCPTLSKRVADQMSEIGLMFIENLPRNGSNGEHDTVDAEHGDETSDAESDTIDASSWEFDIKETDPFYDPPLIRQDQPSQPSRYRTLQKAAEPSSS